MIPSAFDYERATSLDDALAKLKAGGKIIAGGHSLVPLMKLRLSEPERLIDITRISELKGIRESNGRIVIGAGDDPSRGGGLSRAGAPMPGACGSRGDDWRSAGPQPGHHGRQSRACRSVGGLPGGDARARRRHSDRRIDRAPQREGVGLLPGPVHRRSQADEIITAVAVKPVRTAAYAKLHQRASHYAIVGVAAALEITGGTIASARVGLTGASSHAERLTNVEQALTGRPATEDTIDGAAKLAGAGIQNVNSDIHAGEQYRRAMIGVFARRALAAALARG